MVHYYGMIAFKLANLGNGVTVSQIPVTSGGNVKIYVSNNYANMKTITVINKNYASSGPFVTNIKVDANKFKFATSVVLSAAGGVKDVVGPFSISGITFSSVTGLAQGVSQEKRLKVDQGIVSVSVDAETAMIIRLTDVEVNILDDILKVEDVSLVPKNEDGSPALSRGFINQYLTYLTIVMGLIADLQKIITQIVHPKTFNFHKSRSIMSQVNHATETQNIHQNLMMYTKTDETATSKNEVYYPVSAFPLILKAEPKSNQKLAFERDSTPIKRVTTPKPVHSPKSSPKLFGRGSTPKKDRKFNEGEVVFIQKDDTSQIKTIGMIIPKEEYDDSMPLNEVNAGQFLIRIFGEFSYIITEEKNLSSFNPQKHNQESTQAAVVYLKSGQIDEAFKWNKWGKSKKYRSVIQGTEATIQRSPTPKANKLKVKTKKKHSVESLEPYTENSDAPLSAVYSKSIDDEIPLLQRFSQSTEKSEKEFEKEKEEILPENPKTPIDVTKLFPKCLLENNELKSVKERKLIFNKIKIKFEEGKEIFLNLEKLIKQHCKKQSPTNGTTASEELRMVVDEALKIRINIESSIQKEFGTDFFFDLNQPAVFNSSSKKRNNEGLSLEAPRKSSRRKMSLVTPVGKKTQLEHLAGKTLAIDSSIWLHHFLKATPNLRRICKLLFYNIKPVFVFDGQTPLIKKKTTAERRKRKHNSERNLEKAAESLLEARIKKFLLEKDSSDTLNATDNEDMTISTSIDAVENMFVNPNNKTPVSPIKQKKDEYELPDVEVRAHSNNDPHLPSHWELKNFIEDYKDSNDFDDKNFQNLPVEQQMEVILDLKLKSRLGDWKTLYKMQKSDVTAKDFSYLQIENLVYRNKMTEKYADFKINANVVVNPLAHKHKDKPTDRIETGRIAGERGAKRYMLIKNDEGDSKLGGWKMRLETNGEVSVDTKKSEVKEIVDLDDYDTLGRNISSKGIYERTTDILDSLSKSKKKHVSAIVLSSDDEIDDVEFVEVSKEKKDDDDDLLFMDQRKGDLHEFTKSEPSAVKFHGESTLFVSDDEDIETTMARFEKLENQKVNINEKEVPESFFSDNINNNKTENFLLTLSPEDFLFNWMNSIPKSFKLKFNEVGYDWESIVKEVFERFDVKRINNETKFIKKKISKLSLNNLYEQNMEWMNFFKMFLESVKNWRSTRLLQVDNENCEVSDDEEFISITEKNVFVPSAVPSPTTEILNENGNTRSNKITDLIYFEDDRYIIIIPNVSIYNFILSSDVEDENELTNSRNDKEILADSSFSLNNVNNSMQPVDLKERLTQTKENLTEFEVSSTCENKIKHSERSIDVEAEFEESKFFKNRGVELKDNSILANADEINEIEIQWKKQSDVPFNSNETDLVNSKLFALVEDNPSSFMQCKDTHFVSEIIPIASQAIAENDKLFKVDSNISKCKKTSPYFNKNLKMSSEIENKIHLEKQNDRLKGNQDIGFDISDGPLEISPLQKKRKLNTTEIQNILTSNSQNANNDLLQNSSVLQQNLEFDDNGSLICSSSDTESVEDEALTKEGGSAPMDLEELNFTNEVISIIENSNVSAMNDDKEKGEFDSFFNSQNFNRSKEEIDAEINRLTLKRDKYQRDSSDVSSDMIRESKELLELFGIPYITAAAEAESQCAFLNENGLVNGIVTDDSDVFLFGSKNLNVYKNLFNQNQFVLSFNSDDLQKEMNLNRKKFVNLALLLGSDYTEGIKGVGAISAMEILDLFPGEDYWKEVKAGTDKKLCKRIVVPNHFPESIVMEAYMNPIVDTSLQKFQWYRMTNVFSTEIFRGEPNLEGLRDFFEEKLGWENAKLDKILLPILRKRGSLNKTRQTTLENFGFKNNGLTIEKIKSNRLKKTLEKKKKVDLIDLQEDNIIATRGGKSGRGRGRGRGRGKKVAELY
ncbi:DNA repair protein rad2 [Clydaea vesicula]|uniref:DNA repair protein rad2 n=1 Tax=Clydaea vesicula TaxID=447962 RepID=A0AAD5U8U3_9FUNG|nr:DNA repair protein rad2 [Clydaea vesicula]